MTTTPTHTTTSQPNNTAAASSPSTVIIKNVINGHVLVNYNNTTGERHREHDTEGSSTTREDSRYRHHVEGISNSGEVVLVDNR